MTGFTKNFVVKNGLTTGPITLDATTGNASVTNLSVTGNSELGAISNVFITGGSSGYVISTDGSGNLSFIDPTSAAQNPAPMPIVIDAGNTLTIGANYQGLFGYPITVNGTLDVEGILIDVNDGAPAGANTQIQFNNNGEVAGSANLTFVTTTNTLTTKIIKTIPTTVASLPSASSIGAGARAFVTDSTTTTFLAIVGGNGGNSVPVVSNGINWIVG